MRSWCSFPVLERTDQSGHRDILSSGGRCAHCTMSGTRSTIVGLIVAWRPASPLLQILPQVKSHLPQTQILEIVALPVSDCDRERLVLRGVV